MPDRIAAITRKTRETDITLLVNLDGRGNSEIATGVGFFDHMLELFSRHSLIDLTVKAVGDLQVDAHHTVEDVGIVLGLAVDKALGDKRGIVRYGSALIPMDESLAQVAIDLSGRPTLVFKVKFPSPMIGEFPSELIEEFCRALANNAKLTLHIEVFRGVNTHHVAEAIFKATARALRMAVETDTRHDGVPSTKGTL